MSSAAADRLARGRFAVALLACALVAAGCERSAPPAPPAPAPTAARPTAWGSPVADDELLTPTRGAVVVDRSGELSYERSSISAIDADNATHWISPPRDPRQWVIVELPALSRVHRVGASTGAPMIHPRPVSRLRFEGSTDGVSFTELRTVDVEKGKNDQLFDITPTDLRFVRVSTLANHDDADVTVVPTVHLRGEELEPVPPPSFSGRWRVNGQILELSQSGNALSGALRMEPPMIFTGTVSGRVARLAWSRGSENGIAWLAVNRSSTRLNGLWWWIDPYLSFSFGSAWIADRLGNAPSFDVPVPTIADIHIRKNGRFSLYNLVLRPDGELDVEASASGLDFLNRALQAFPSYKIRLELVACDSWIEQKNLEAGRPRAAKLAASLERAGIPPSRLIVEARSRTDLPSPLYRFLYDQIEFSLAGN